MKTPPEAYLIVEGLGAPGQVEGQISFHGCLLRWGESPEITQRPERTRGVSSLSPKVMFPGQAGSTSQPPGRRISRLLMSSVRPGADQT